MILIAIWAYKHITWARVHIMGFPTTWASRGTSTKSRRVSPS